MLEAILTLLAVGYASAYSPGVFEKVIQNRQNNLTSYSLPSELSIDRYIAVEDCTQVGKEALVFFDNHYEKVLIADCAGIQDGGRDWMQRNNIAAELDWNTFSEYKDSCPLEIRVYLIDLKLKYQYR